MNAVILAVLVMLVLALCRVSVMFALLMGAIVGGLYAGMPINEVVNVFNSGLGGGAQVAIAYAALGAFAVALSHTGVTQSITRALVTQAKKGSNKKSMTLLKWGMVAGLILVGFIAETVVPIHIAFIPILVPPLLGLFNMMKVDRRLIAPAITFAIIAAYLFIPVGFGKIYLENILVGNINKAGEDLGLVVHARVAPIAMLLPAGGMFVGLLLAFLFFSRKREYQDRPIIGTEQRAEPLKINLLQKIMVAAALIAALVTQLWTDSMVFGGMVGFALISISGVIKWSEQDSLATQGVRMMAQVAFIMIAAAGFAAVMRATGAIPELVAASSSLIGDSKAVAALVMLLVGFLVSMGIGSSFSTIPIIATIYVPLGIEFGFSPMAILALIGTAAALGDCGSPASDSTLGPTAGLNADGQHDHIKDTVIPSFVFLSLPLLVAGWISAMIL